MRDRLYPWLNGIGIAIAYVVMTPIFLVHQWWQRMRGRQ